MNVIKSVEVRVPIYPTEKKEIVEKLISNIFPSFHASMSEILEGEDHSVYVFKGGKELLENLRHLFRVRGVELSVFQFFRSQFSEGVLFFTLNKQAALHGIASLGEEHPLGVIEVVVECDEEDLAWIAGVE